MSQSESSITTTKHIILKRNNYPENLREIYQSPDQLYIQGTLPEGIMVAVVGTRKPTPYGKAQAYRLSYELAQAWVIVVSGLAHGIDGIAHQAALDAGGRTIAVLGCGLDVCYPAVHRGLVRAIVEGGGAVVSEYADGTPPLRHHFPARNRIISGLSVGVLIPEADARSGSLITALLALDQNRIVMAVPGNVTSQRSAGPNNLIRAGAVPIHSTRDIWMGLGLEPPYVCTPDEQPPQTSRSRLETDLLDSLAQGNTTVESLAHSLRRPVAEISSCLVLLEVIGEIISLGGGHWMARPAQYPASPTILK